MADAEYFMEDYFPTVTFILHSRGTTSEPITVGINYSLGRDEMDRYDSEDPGWQCREVCFQRYVTRSPIRFSTNISQVLRHELPAPPQVLQVLRATTA
jgi:hypothetical protein